jgi:hypothetical protein
MQTNTSDCLLRNPTSPLVFAHLRSVQQVIQDKAGRTTICRNHEGRGQSPLGAQLLGLAQEAEQTGGQMMQEGRGYAQTAIQTGRTFGTKSIRMERLMGKQALLTDVRRRKMGTRMGTRCQIDVQTPMTVMSAIPTALNRIIVCTRPAHASTSL